MATNRTEPPSLPGKSAGLQEYLKQAFFFRWNMLLFAGGVVGAALTPWPDALIPLVAAAEFAYLGGLVAFPRFRRAIDAQTWQAGKQKQSSGAVASPVQEIVARLSVDSRRRFEQVRTRCLEMRAIASEVRGRSGPQGTLAEDMSTPALDRLLWVFLRLLVSHEALSRFLERTNVEDIRTRLAHAKTNLEQHVEGDERIIRSLNDSVAAQEQRLDNYDSAKKNAEFVRFELDRIEAKIHALTESAVNRQDTEFLSSQIDSVAESMQSTEKAISELQQITGLVDEMQDPPAILEADMGKVAGS
ncbi:MAG: hypothetical protein H7Y20_02105 [Bryobacteraceae bacterium]|nr:hypothetical protein [Bryobacteraceae bacterium]